MSYAISTRPMSDEERERLLSALRRSTDNWAWIIAPLAGCSFLAFVVGHGIEWLLGKIGWFVEPYLHWSLVAISLPFGIRVSFLFLRAFQVTAAETQRDISIGITEVIEVQNALLVEQAEYNDEGPILFFDIGDGKILFLYGQWLYAHLPRFPSSNFTVYRSAVLGRVFTINTNGEHIEPLRTLPPFAVPIGNLHESELLDGSLDDLPAAVARAKLMSGR
jgi:hypothetical protein